MRTVVTHTKNICLHHEGIATYVAKRHNHFWNFRLDIDQSTLSNVIRSKKILNSIHFFSKDPVDSSLIHFAFFMSALFHQA
jgi:hypothetical protein